MNVVLVDPVSTGVSVLEAFRERGVEPLRVYQPVLAEAYAADPAPEGTLLHEDLELTCRALEDYGAEAVLAVSETAIPLADALGAALGLPHNDPALAPARYSKLEEARALEAAGLPCARTEGVSSPADVTRALERFDRYPVVVKPVASAGSDGLAVCDDADDARRAIEAVLGQRNAVGSVNEHVVVQEHLDGLQYIIDTVSIDGRHAFSDVFVSRFDEIDGKPILRNKISRRELSAAETEVVEYGLRCLDAVGVRNGAGHTEVRLTHRGPRLIEVNPRLMGPIMPADVYVPAFGCSQATLLADSVLGGPAFEERVGRPYRPGPQHMAFIFLHAWGEGPLSASPGLDEIRRLPSFHSFAKLPTLGQDIPHPLLTLASAGIAYFRSPDAQQIVDDMNRVHALEDEGRIYSRGGRVPSRSG
jgi:biotin carboxylase